MAGPLSEDERKMIEDEGLTVDRFREKFDEAGQEDLDRENWRDMVSLWKNRPTRMEDVKMKRIIERIETERKKAEERKAGTKKYIRWMTIYDTRAQGRRYLEVEVDEGTNANFLTQGMAADRGFKVHSLDSKSFQGETVSGDVVCEQYVDLTLVGKEHEHVTARFLILPPHEPPNDPRITKPLVGRRLLQECGHLLLADDPREPIWSTKMGKESAYMKEQSKQQAANVQSYQANASRSRDASRSKKDGNEQNSQAAGSSAGKKN